MLKNVELLPKEHLMKKYSQITGMSMFDVSEIIDHKGIEAIADIVEEQLLLEAIHARRQAGRDGH